MPELLVLGTVGIFSLGLPTLSEAQIGLLFVRRPGKICCAILHSIDVHFIKRIPYSSLPSKVQICNSGSFHFISFHFISFHFISFFLFHFFSLCSLAETLIPVCAFVMWMTYLVERGLKTSNFFCSWLLLDLALDSYGWRANASAQLNMCQILCFIIHNLNHQIFPS